SLDLIGQDRACLSDIVPEFIRGQSVEPPMSVSVRSDLVPGVRNFPYQPRKPLSNPPEHKECSGDSVLREQFKYALNISLDSRCKGVPLIIANLRCNRF